MEGNSNDYWGTNNGTDTSVSYGTSYGKVAQGGLFTASGSNGISTSLFISGNGSRSYAAWFKPTGTNNAIMAMGNPSTGQQFAMASYGTGLWFASNNNNCYGGTAIADGNWHFGVITYGGGATNDASTGIKIYVDNVLQTLTSNGASWGGTLNTTGHSLVIGNGDAYTDNAFGGDIDEVGIWSKVLSTQEISDLYNGGAGQTMCWGDTQSDSMMNAASRFATVAFTKRFVAALAATIMNAASRFTTLAGNLLILVRNVSVTMMNAASRLATLTGTITKYVAALSVSMMNSASRLATLFGQQMKYIANLSVSMMNSVSRFVVLTTGNAKILVVNMMNAAGRLTTLFSQQMLFIRNLTVNMMYAVNRLTSFLVTIPGTWAFRAKNLTSWAFRSKNNTSWTFRTKNPPGAENIPSEPN